MSALERNEAELGTWIEQVIKQFCLESPENSLKYMEAEKAWDEPLVGFSSGADPLYSQLKQDIGPFYLTPIEAFKKAFPDVPSVPSELTVVSWILPQTKATRADNRKESSFPAERWARSRFFGENFNVSLRDHVCAVLRSKGVEAIAPMNSPFFSLQESERYSFASNWSERHAAFVAGLGTFGLCDGLITPVGKAVRCGSVIARISVPATKRPYIDHHEYCLHFSHGKCDKCAQRCPAGAVTSDGHNKIKCRSYLNKMAEYSKDRFGIETYGCGLCQTGVPCEFRIPVRGKSISV